MRLVWLSLVCAGLVLTYDALYGGRGLKTSNSDSEPAVRLLVPTSVKIVLAQGLKKLTLTKENNVWTVFEKDQSSKEFQDSLTTSLDMLSVAKIERSFLVLPAGIGKYGINDEAMSVKIVANKTGPYIIKHFNFGSLTPDSYGQYIYEEDSMVMHVIPAYQGRNLTQLLTDFTAGINY